MEGVHTVVTGGMAAWEQEPLTTFSPSDKYSKIEKLISLEGIMNCSGFSPTSIPLPSLPSPLCHLSDPSPVTELDLGPCLKLVDEPSEGNFL